MYGELALAVQTFIAEGRKRLDRIDESLLALVLSPKPVLLSHARTAIRAIDKRLPSPHLHNLQLVAQAEDAILERMPRSSRDRRLRASIALTHAHAVASELLDAVERAETGVETADLLALWRQLQAE